MGPVALPDAPDNAEIAELGAPPAPRLVASDARMFTKGSLVALAHGIEASLLDAEPDPGDLPVVIALFQKEQFFAPERRRYRAIARHSLVTLVGFADRDPDVPTPIIGIPLDPSEELAGTFGLVIISKCICVSLIGVDKTDESTEQRNRRFETRWSFDRAHAVEEARRLLAAFGNRVPAAQAQQVEQRLRDAEAAVPRRIEARLTAAFEQMVKRYQWAASRVNELEDEVTRLNEMKTGTVPAEYDALTGVLTRPSLARFLGQLMVESRTSQVAVAWLDVNDLDAINTRFGRPAGDAALRLVAKAIQTQVRENDCFVRWGSDEFVVVMPGMQIDTAKRRALEFIDAVSATSMPDPYKTVRVSISCGVGVGDFTALALSRLRESANYGRTTPPA